MTQEEFDALPDVTGGWGTREEERNGQIVRVPCWSGFAGALFHGPDDPIVTVDRNGQRWMIGRKDGVLVKRRSTNL